MELPANFNQYKKLIEFYRAQGVDCLKSNIQKYKFIYCYMDDYVVEKSNEQEICFMNELGLGVSRIFVKHDASFVDQYNKLGNAKSYIITSYLRDTCNIKMKFNLNDKKITITNSFNNSQIVLAKQLFDLYCGYSVLNEDYNQQMINIPVKFDDVSAKIFVDCINSASMMCPKFEELLVYDQVIELMNFLCVNF